MPALRRLSLCFIIILLCARAYSDDIIRTRQGITDSLLSELFKYAESELDYKKGKQRIKPVRPDSNSLLAKTNSVQVSFISKGMLLGKGVAGGSTLPANARLASYRALKGVNISEGVKVDILLEVMLRENYLRLKNPLEPGRSIDGIRQGFRFDLGTSRELLVSASDILLSGRGTNRALYYAIKENNSGIDEHDIIKPATRFFFFDSIIAVRLSDGDICRFSRFGRHINISDVNKSLVQKSLALAGKWFLNNRDSAGNFRYLYFPRNGQDWDKNALLIRQIFGIASTGDIFPVVDNSELKNAGQKALGLLIEKKYLEHPTRGYGYIREGKKITLGNSASALCAIIRLEGLKKYKKVSERLAAFLNAMRDKDGCYYMTAGEKLATSAAQNYYSGEAQLALMEYYEATGKKEILDGVMKSYKYYKGYFAKKHSYPFIPWHTQACVKLYRATRNHDIVKFVFNMNDQLINAQQIDGMPEDVQGRFFNPEKRSTGYPHVSSTGVYIEGLSEAYFLARQIGDVERSEKYRKVILWAVRNMIQLQMRGKFSTWLAVQPNVALGGFCTRKDTLDIRIDNMQHCATALAKVLKEFSISEYRIK
jgi:hypothetical protein